MLLANSALALVLSTVALAQSPAPQDSSQTPPQVPHVTTAAPSIPMPQILPAILIKHGEVHTVGAAGTLKDADVLIQNGKVAAVGQNLSAPPGAKVIDAKGKPVTPGLMVSYSQLGIEEIEGGAQETNDTTRDSDIDNAAYNAVDAINPESTLIPVARIRGVTRALTGPVFREGVFDGQAAIIDLGLGPNIVDKAQAGMLAQLSHTEDKPHQTRADLWAEFRETLDDAREYWAQRAGYHRPGGARDQRSFRIDLDALGPVIQGKEPLIVKADRASDMRRIIAYCQQNHIKLIILGAAEGWRMAHELAAAQVPVILDTEQNLPESFSQLGATLKNAALLDAAGVKVLFEPQSDDPGHYARTITQIAGIAVAYGMPWEHALAAITKNPSEAFGLADSYGTLEVGKDGDVVVWDGDPLEVTSAPTAVFIKGQVIPMRSRQTELRDRYRDLDKKSPRFGYR